MSPGVGPGTSAPPGGEPTRGRLSRIGERVYADFLMPSRLASYAALLQHALERGYAVLPVGEWGGGHGAAGGPASRVIVLRHDIDTDPRTAARMFAIDMQLDIRSSYFFRLGTLDMRLMGKITAAGGEASYHYEELATIIKRRRLRTRAQALSCLPEARAAFARNIDRLRGTTGLPMRVVASHGDVANRRLGVNNWEILADPAFRAQVGVTVEAYDADLLARLPVRFTDTLHPQYWDPASPVAAIDSAQPAIQVLVHPRHWRTDPGGNLLDDLRRLADEVRLRR
jgi:hypothetical protein